MIFKVSKRDNLDRHYIIKLFGCGVFLHYIHDNEPENSFHNHPWNGVSFIFGSYLEQYLDRKPTVRRFFNFIKASRHHRVTLPHGPVWTLFIHGRRCNKWSVVDEKVKLINEEPWRGIGGQTSYVEKKS